MIARPARFARGEYLVNNVTDCMDCHAEHDWTQHDAPALPGTLGSGQDMSILKGFPGQVVAPNITSDPETGAGNWSDDQLARAIREGVGHDGRALFPFMPYPDFRNMSDEDLASIIVYLRALPPVKKQRQPTALIFPVKYLIRSVPQPINAPVPEPGRFHSREARQISRRRRRLHRLPHAGGRAWPAAARHGLRRRLHSRRPLGPRSQR